MRAGADLSGQSRRQDWYIFCSIETAGSVFLAHVVVFSAAELSKLPSMTATCRSIWRAPAVCRKVYMQSIGQMGCFMEELSASTP